MKDYIVLVLEASRLPADPPIAFPCRADDPDHAEEQATNAYPDGEVVWVYSGKSIPRAFRDYWG